MKQLALSQLQEAIRILNYTLSDINADTVENAKEDIRNAIVQINGAIYSETPNTSRNFDIFKMASTDDMRPVMCGVFHNEGFKVASDTHVLVAVKESYDDALEGHILDKTGKDIIGKYPRWRDVLPKKEDGDMLFTIDTAQVYELIKAEKVEKKAAWKWGTYRKAYVKVGDAFFRADTMAKLCTFMDAYGAKEIRIKDRRRAATVYAPDGSIAIIMPTICAGSDYNAPYLPEVYEKERDKHLWYEAA